MGWFGKKDTKPKMIERESEMFNVIQNLVTQPDCIIEINPENMTYMLSLDKEQYYLYIEDQGVQFSNHGFIVIRSYTTEVIDAYTKIVREETIRRRNQKHAAIFTNEVNLLKLISAKLTDRTKSDTQTSEVVK